MQGGRYQLIDVLGSGDNGEVWRGRDRSTERMVAIKVLHPDLAADPRLVDRFQRARHVLTGLWHTGIARLLDVVVEDGRIALVTDFVSGVDLRQHMPLSPERAVQVGASIAGALAAAHRVGVVHGDIKPSNVVIPFAEGEPAQLTDFSVALFVRAGHYRTSPYHPPDEIEGAVPGPAGDVYALGMLLSELGLHDVVSDCLDPDPAARPTSEEVQARLSTAKAPVARSPIPAERPRAGHTLRPPRAPREVRRRPPRISLLAGVGLVALLLVGTFAYLLTRSGPTTQSGPPGTSTAGPGSAPGLPAAAATWTQPGGAAFVEYWFASLSYATRTGDTSTFTGVTNAACGGCRPASDAIRAGYADGGSLAGGSYLVREIRTSSLWTNERPVYDVSIDRAPRSRLDRTGTIKETLPALSFANCTLVLEWVDAHWRVLEVPTSGCIA